MQTQTRFEVGPHRVEYEESTGFLKMTQNGVLEGGHADQIGEIFGKFTAGRNGIFVLADNTGAKGITPEARKRFGQKRTIVSADSTTYIAIFGSSFAFRAIANLVMTAIRLTGLNLNGTTAASESEARAWLEEKKQLHDGKA